MKSALRFLAVCVSVVAVSAGIGCRSGKHVPNLVGNPVFVEQFVCDDTALAEAMKNEFSKRLSSKLSSEVLFTRSEEAIARMSPGVERFDVTMKISVMLAEQSAGQVNRGRRGAEISSQLVASLPMGFNISVLKDGVQVDSDSFYQTPRRGRYYNPVKMAQIMGDRATNLILKHDLAYTKMRWVPTKR